MTSERHCSEVMQPLAINDLAQKRVSSPIPPTCDFNDAYHFEFALMMSKRVQCVPFRFRLDDEQACAMRNISS